ncbi:HEPN domain-containing protein [bacterium]|nr:HEPN domain-containing protein [bacterium]
MNNIKRSEMLFTAAEESLAQAKFSFERRVWNLAIRRAQEAVELCLGGILALMGIHYPKDHDQAPLAMRVLKAHGLAIDEEKSQKIQEISIDLSRKRGPALHQEEGYDKITAQQAIKDARFVLNTIKEVKSRLLAKMKRKEG